MATGRTTVRNYKRMIGAMLPRMLEHLEARVLLAGNTYSVAAYDFTGGVDGSMPFGTLVADTAGNLFGTTVNGGNNGVGGVFELPSGANLIALHNFAGTPQGANPYGGLVRDAEGNFFGTTLNGGAFGKGSIFEIPAGSNAPVILHSFSGADGANPYASLTIDSSGDLFGTTVNGGQFNKGTVFEFPIGDQLTTLHSFHGASDGQNPYGALVMNASGNLFGTTFAGGSSDSGTVFKIVGSTFSTVHTFSGDEDDGGSPTGQLAVDGGGNLFGTTFAGGTDNLGTLYAVAASDNSVTLLYSFTGGVDGAHPYAGMVFDSSGNLFGTTFHGGSEGRGTVFEVPFAESTPRTLYSFTGGLDGALPYASVVISSQGNIFGTTTGGGSSGRGSIFELLPTLTTQISIRRQPTDTQAGHTISPSVIIDLKKANNTVNTADNSSVTLSIVSGPVGADLLGTTTVAAHNGTATFDNLRLNRAGTYTLAAAAGSLDPVTLTTFVVTPGLSSRLVFDQQPTSIVAGDTITPAVTVEVQDSLGNTTTDNSMVTLKIASGPAGALLTGTLTVQAVNGVATFGDLSLTKAGSYTFSVTNGIFSSPKSTVFAVTADAASAHLEITRQPGNVVVGKTLSPAVTVSLQDQYGNLILSNSAQVSATLVVVNLAGNATSVSLTGTTTINLAKGAGSFGNLAVSQPGDFQLQLSSGGLAPVNTTTFTSDFVPTHLAFIQQPSLTAAGSTMTPAVTIAIVDSSNRIDTTNNGLVTLTLKGNGTLNGTLSVLAVNGLATFNDLSINQAGTYMLSAASSGLGTTKSANFRIVPDVTTAHLAALTLPTGSSVVGKTLSPNLAVKVVDQFGNLITTDLSAATLSIATGPSNGTITGITTINGSGGIKTFKNLTLPIAGNYSLQVTDSSLADPTPLVFAQTITQGVTAVTGLPGSVTRSFGQTVTLTANFKSNAPSSVPFTGVATLIDSGSNVLGTVTLTTGGKAQFNIAGLAPGTYLTTVSYPGDQNHTAVTSSTFTLQVNLARTSTTLTTSSSTLVFGQPLTLTATVNSSTAPGVPRTGSASFYDGAILLGTVGLDGNSMASLTLSSPVVGKHNFKAIYLGDENFLTSISSGVGRTVSRDKTTIALTASESSPMPVNQTFNLNVHVAILAPGTSTLTGNLVTIKDNGKVLTTLNLDPSGDASYTIFSYTTSGTHNLTAIYAGDTNTLAVTSATLKLTIV